MHPCLQAQQQPDHSEGCPNSPSSTLLRLREYSTQSPLPSLRDDASPDDDHLDLIFSQQSTDLNATLSSTDLPCPVLSVSLPTSPSLQLSSTTLSGYCVELLFDGYQRNYVSRADVPAKVSGAYFSAPTVASHCMPSVFTANLCGGFCTKYDE